MHVRSAGSAPSDALHPRAVEVMHEIGIELASAFPKPLTDDVVRATDVVITMGRGDACPIYPGKRYEDWDLRDPADSTLKQAREVRDEIDARVRHLLTEILPASTTPH
ncbi:heat-shock protein HtpX [Brachybacterium sp. GPGPB12]|uniref:arsenate reductase/protein-tyrosine-phosphatase family protein n=1 Tax=Brachybacterium sp. GPGPB12 TaxID=3023517 RepID=UPI0031344BC1